MDQPDKDYIEYCELVDKSILSYINETSLVDLPREDYHGFFDYDLKNIEKILPEEQQLQKDGANFCRSAFNIGACPSKVAEILAEALYNNGWCS